MGNKTNNDYKPVTLAGLHWIRQGTVVSYGTSRRGYGIQYVATGEVLFMDGEPVAYPSRNDAAKIAKHAGSLTAFQKVAVYPTVARAQAALSRDAAAGAIAQIGRPRRNGR